MKVIPEDEAIVLHYAEHLSSYLVFHHGIEHGGEDRELHDEIEGRIREGQRCGIPTYNAYRCRAYMSGCNKVVKK